jgi:hypothetical protein
MIHDVSFATRKCKCIRVDEPKHTRGGHVITPADESRESTTQDLHRAANPAYPGAGVLEARGKWFVTSGLATTALTIALTVVWDHGFHDDMPLAYALPLYFVSLGCVFVGCMEYLNRPARAALAEQLARMDRLERQLIKVIELLPTEMQQQYFQGRAASYREMFSDRTGTDAGPARGTAEVVRLQRRNDRPGR